MFSEVQRDFIEKLVLSDSSRPYYIAYSNNFERSTTNNDVYDFFVICSSEKIQAEGRYDYVIPSDSVCYAVRSSNSSNFSHSERVATLACPSSLTIENYEFVYTNAEFEGVAMQPDLLATQSVIGSHFQGAAIAVLIVLLSVIFFKFIKRG